MRVHRVRTTGLRRAWYDSPWRIAGRAFSCALTILLVALTVALAVVPKLTGGTTLTVLTGSMEPTLSPGDVAVVRGIDVADVCAEVGIGDIVTFFPTPDDATLITHRVVGKSVGSYEDGTTCRLLTQGDANSAADEPVSPEQVRGVFLFGLPKLGWVRQWAGEHTQALLVIGAVLLIAWGVWSTLRRPRTRVVALTGVPGTGPTVAEDADPAPQPHTRWADPWAVDPRPAGARDTDLRERELALREREVALRERELELARRQLEAASGTVGTGEADPTDEAAPAAGPATDEAPR